MVMSAIVPPFAARMRALRQSVVASSRAEAARETFRPVVGCRRRSDPGGRLPCLLSIVGQQPPDHHLLARREVKLCPGQLSVSEDELDVGEGRLGSSAIR
jgi:hypothetical protein